MIYERVLTTGGVGGNCAANPRMASSNCYGHSWRWLTVKRGSVMQRQSTVFTVDTASGNLGALREPLMVGRGPNRSK